MVSHTYDAVSNRSGTIRPNGIATVYSYSDLNLPPNSSAACRHKLAVEKPVQVRYAIAMKKYKMIVHRDSTSGFWAEVPELPGCVSQGDTLEELQLNIHDAIEGYLEVMQMEGQHPEEVEILEVAV